MKSLQYFTQTSLTTLLALTTTFAIAPSAHAEPQSPTTPEHTAAQQAYEHPTLNWHPCDAKDLADQGMECADFTVPLDYSNYDLGTLTLPVTRKPAENPDQKIGSLFTNPGGPGGEATIMPASFAQDLGPEVAQKFDIIGIAPRGIEGAEQAQCLKQGADPDLDEAVFPMTDAEIQQHFAMDKAIQDACAHGPRILEHMTTADVARDMDLARQAVGDDKLTYYGISYGTYVGATYAAMFPNNIRALVVDGVVDPVGWATGRGPNQGSTETVDERLASGNGAKEAMIAAIGECQKAGSSRCAVADTVGDDWRNLTQFLRMGPVTLPDGEQLRYDTLHSMVMGTLYSPTTIPGMLQAVHELAEDLKAAQEVEGREIDRPAEASPRDAGGEQAIKAMKSLKELADKASEDNPAAPDAIGTTSDTSDSKDNEDSDSAYDVKYPGVLCTGSANPTTEEAFIKTDDRAWGDTGGFGQLWNWQSSVCSHWPVKGSGVYTGPFNIPTSVPVSSSLVLSMILLLHI